MAGHSQFKNIMHRKGAQDAKRAKLFAKLAREITVAAKSGMPDPKQNPRLRNAMINARHDNMPNDRINKAISQWLPYVGIKELQINPSNSNPNRLNIFIQFYLNSLPNIFDSVTLEI